MRLASAMSRAMAVVLSLVLACGAVGRAEGSKKLSCTKKDMEARLLKTDFGRWKFAPDSVRFVGDLKSLGLLGTDEGGIISCRYTGGGGKSVVSKIVGVAEYDKILPQYRDCVYQRTCTRMKKNEAGKLAGKPVVLVDFGASVVCTWWTDDGIMVQCAFSGPLDSFPEDLAKAYMDRYPSAIDPKFKPAADWDDWHRRQVLYHARFLDDDDPKVKAQHVNALIALVGWEFEYWDGHKARHLGSVRSFKNWCRQILPKWHAPFPGAPANREESIAKFYTGQMPEVVPDWAKKK